MAEDAIVGTTVGVTGLATDADVTDTVTYTLDDECGRPLRHRRQYAAWSLSPAAFDYETATNHNITIRATSTDGSFATEIFVISVTDVNELGVTAISDSDAAADFVLENVAPGAVGRRNGVCRRRRTAPIRSATRSTTMPAGGLRSMPIRGS